MPCHQHWCGQVIYGCIIIFHYSKWETTDKRTNIIIPTSHERYSVSNHCQLDCFFNTLRLRQDGHHFPDDIFKWIFLNENVWILIKISLKFVPWGQINNNPALVQMMAWHRPGDKPLSKPMMVTLLTHICITRPQWANSLYKLTSRTYQSLC